MTKRRFAALAGLLGMSIVLAGGAVLAEEKQADEVTIRGEVLDLACYVGQEAKGTEHAGCAKKCLKQGQPMGLLASDGTVYLLFADHADATAYNQAKELAGKNVEIRGAGANKGSLKGITVHQVKPV